MFRKSRIFFLLFFYFLCARAFSQTDAHNGPSIGIPLASAAYYNKSTGAVDVYFYVSTTGRINAALKLKPPGKQKLEVSFDGAPSEHALKKAGSADGLQVLDIGSFEADSIGYHSVSIRGLKASEESFDARSLVLSGEPVKGMVFNNSEYRGAASTHLRYRYPLDSSVNAFYCEIKVPPEAQSLNSYYMTNGFKDGYMGIQINSSTERRVLFSIWSSYQTDNPKEIPSDYIVKLIRKGKDVQSGDFGNEGSGGQTFLRFNWKADTVYKLLVTAEAKGDNTIFSGYFYAPETAQWKLIGEWDKPRTGGRLLGSLYSFVENFSGNGDDLFKAFYGNQWIRTESGSWIELTHARFTTTASPEKHQRLDYGGGAAGNWFHMFSGGFKNAGKTKPNDEYDREKNGVPPVIESLP